MRAQSKTTAPAGNEWLPNVVGNLTAAGNSQGTALAIPATQDCSVFTTVASGTGCRLPAVGVTVSEEQEVVNHGANALSVYPPSGGQIGTLGANTAYSLAAGKLAKFRLVGPLQYASCP